MELLLNDEYAPITSNIGFIEAEYERTVDVFTAWQKKLAEERGESLMTRQVAGPLPRALDALLPLTIPEVLRSLLVPTASRWVAYFDSSKLGTDAEGPLAVLGARLPSRTLRVMAIPDSLGTSRAKGHRGRYGASVLDLEAHGDQTIRSISLVNDGGRWSFEHEGAPLTVEEPDAYEARRIADRFPFALLARYCMDLGVRPFDASFYLPPSKVNATLIERIPPVIAKVKTFSLADLHSEWGRTPGEH